MEYHSSTLSTSSVSIIQPDEREAALKILKFFKMVVSVKKAYLKQMRKVLSHQAFRIQSAFRAYQLRKLASEKRIYCACLILNTKGLCNGDVSKVEVFGEFTAGQPCGAWGKKVECQQLDESTFGAMVEIGLDQKFKFVIDGGQQYVVSQSYLQRKDEDGNTNNLFRFHDRTKYENFRVISSYKTNLKLDSRDASELKEDKSKEPVEFRQQIKSQLSPKHPSPRRSNALGSPQPLKSSLRDNQFHSYQQKLSDYMNRQVFDEEQYFLDYSASEKRSMGSPRAVTYSSSTLDTDFKEQMQFMEFENPLEMLVEADLTPNFKDLFDFHSSSNIDKRQKMKQNLRSSLCNDSEPDANGFLMFSAKASTDSQGAVMRKKSTLDTTAAILPMPLLKASSNNPGSKVEAPSPMFGQQLKLNIDFSRLEKKEEVKKQPQFHQHAENNDQNLSILSAAYSIGKSKTNEDAWLTMERGFGVADGVSGWNDFRLSSEAFSHNSNKLQSRN